MVTNTGLSSKSQGQAPPRRHRRHEKGGRSARKSPLETEYHYIHTDETFQWIPLAWTATLAGLGYSEAEIALVLKGHRNRAPDLTSVQDDPLSTLNHGLCQPRYQSTSLRRLSSDASTSWSERSMRSGPPLPPSPLSLPLPLQSSQAPNHWPPASPPPMPVSALGTSVEAGDVGA